jgi:hypothetical protein
MILKLDENLGRMRPVVVAICPVWSVAFEVLPVMNRWRCELEMKLEVRKPVAGPDAAGPRRDFHVARGPLPVHLVSPTRPPGQTAAIKQHDSVGGRGGAVTEGRARSGNGWLRSSAVMDMPVCTGNQRRVLVAQRLIGGTHGRVAMQTTRGDQGDPPELPMSHGRGTSAMATGVLPPQAPARRAVRSTAHMTDRTRREGCCLRGVPPPCSGCRDC